MQPPILATVTYLRREGLYKGCIGRRRCFWSHKCSGNKSYTPKRSTVKYGRLKAIFTEDNAGMRPRPLGQQPPGRRVNAVARPPYSPSCRPGSAPKRRAGLSLAPPGVLEISSRGVSPRPPDAETGQSRGQNEPPARCPALPLGPHGGPRRPAAGHTPRPAPRAAAPRQQAAPGARSVGGRRGSGHGGAQAGPTGPGSP